MSEVVLQPWMRQSETAEPIPAPAEMKLAYIAVRGCIENAHEEARLLDEGDMLHLHPGSYCMETLTLETDDEGGTVVLSKRTEDNPADPENPTTEYKITLLEKGMQHEYICDDAKECVRRKDMVADVSVNSLTLEDELATLLNDGENTYNAAETSPAVGVTIEPRETGVLIGIVSQATFLPQQTPGK